MKQPILQLLLVIGFGTVCAQTNQEIASVYIKKAKQNLESREIETAEVNFNKAVRFLKNKVTNAEVDRLGTAIKYQQKRYKEAEKFAKHYFKIVEDKTTPEYANQLELYVEIEEKIDSLTKVNQQLEAKKQAHQAELKRVASLKEDWKNKSLALSLKADFVGSFNKDGIAIFKQNSFVGVLNDKASILIKADKYKDYRFLDGYVLLLDQVKNPTQILCFDTKTQKTSMVPSASSFNTLATNYGNVTSPRGNNLLVAYPNNTPKTFIYNLKTKQFIQLPEEDKAKEFFKSLKSIDKIDSYNKKGQVKVNKEWYFFGGAIGGGVYTLYNEDLSFYGYLFQSDGATIEKQELGYLGSLYQNKIEVSKNGNTSWINNNRAKVSGDTGNNYTGSMHVDKLENGNYQFIQNNETIILEGKTLEPINKFLKKNKVKESYF